MVTTAVFDPFSTANIGTALLLAGRGALNIYTACHMFWILPRRDPTQVGNEALHQVAWVEFSVQAWNLIVFLARLLNHDVGAMYNIKFAANFSCLSLLGYLTPSKASA